MEISEDTKIKKDVDEEKEDPLIIKKEFQRYKIDGDLDLKKVLNKCFNLPSTKRLVKKTKLQNRKRRNTRLFKIFQEENEDFFCKMCNLGFTSKRTFRKHFLWKHDKRTRQCPECDEIVTFGRFPRHRKSHIDFKCPFCEKKIKYRQKSTHVVTCPENPEREVQFNCNQCDYKTCFKYNLYRHSQKHSKLSCELCEPKSRQLYSFAKLERHKLRAHRAPKTKKPKVKIFKCDFCDHQYTRKHALKRHEENCRGKNDVVMIFIG